MYTPKVSIVIPAYNASNYLGEAIDSALAQTYPNVEIIVINDGSVDGGKTEQVALAYGDKIRYFSKENGGSSSALNMGIANMTGDWFSWLSHDDLYLPEKIERNVEYLRALKADESMFPEYIIFSAHELIDANGKTIRAHHEGQSRSLAAKVASFPHNGYLIAEPTKYCFHGCSCLVHKDTLAKVGGFDERLRLLNDLDLWYRLYAAGYQVQYIPEPLVKGRVHDRQVSKSIGYSYHNLEQDMFWNRSLDWLLANYPDDEKLFYRFGRNAYLKTRNTEGDRAFAHIKYMCVPKTICKAVYMSCAFTRKLAKNTYIKLKT